MGEPARIIEAFRRLSRVEKLALLDDLWLETAQEVNLTEVSDDERRFLAERLRDAEEHVDEEQDWTDFRAGLVGISR